VSVGGDTMKYPKFVRMRGTLKIKVEDSFNNSAAWGTQFFTNMKSTFNSLSNSLKLKVTLDPLTADYPKPEIILKAHGGTLDYVDEQGHPQSAQADMDPNHFRGYTIRTSMKGGEGDPAVVVFQSFVFMNNTPAVNGQLITPEVRMAMLLHEILHACGLGGTEPMHGNGNSLPNVRPHDLFSGFGIYTPGDPYVDFLDTQAPNKRTKKFELSPQTILALQRNWEI
jgi:hypothetical protein